MSLLLVIAGCRSVPGDEAAPQDVAPGGTAPGSRPPVIAVEGSRVAKSPPLAASDALSSDRYAGAVPDTDDTDATAARLRRLFARARALVEADIGTDLSAVRLRLVDDRTIIDEVRAETRRLVRERLGDGPLAERLLQALVAGQAGTYAALYSPRQRSVMVSRDVLQSYLASVPPEGGRRDAALLVLMLHELVHAADDIRYAIHDNRTLDFRASFAQSAAFEGHAQWRTRVLCRRHGCLDGLASLEAFMFGDPSPAGATAVGHPGSRGDVERDLLEYSYVEGERFVAALAARPNGEALIERLLSSPPDDPLQILDPASFPDGERERRNRRLLSASRRVEHPWLGDGGTRVAVETSPLKGVSLGDDPSRRAAAIDGFTRLVTAMVAVQFHDPSATTISPVEVTLMQTDAVSTARLFADTLHAHALVHGTDADAGTGGDGVVRDRSRLARTATVLPDGGVWRTAIATDGTFVVQASGRDAEASLMDAYVLGALDVLLGTDPVEDREPGSIERASESEPPLSTS